jgi:iron complex outermembrane recepter protein
MAGLVPSFLLASRLGCGAINLVHFQPLAQFHYGASIETGSWGTVKSQDYVTGPTTIPGLNYRVDATFSHADGFRDLGNHDYEIRPDFPVERE